MNKLQQWLDQQGIKQIELAQRLNMRPETVNRIVNGKKDAGPEFILRFAATFGYETAQDVLQESQA